MARKRATQTAPTFCRRYVYVSSLDRLYDRQTGNFITVQAASRRHGDEVPAEASVQYILLRGADAVDKADGVTFWPGKPEFVGEDGGRQLNLWTKLELRPTSGSVWPFTRHLARIVDGNQIAIDFVLDYYAHLVQRPGEKIRSALLFIGRPGTGKGFLADVAMQLVGERNAVAISAGVLASDFNGWIEGSGLTVVEELVADNSRQTAAKLKGWITDERLLINKKGIEPYKCRNRTHFILLSNDHDAAIVDPDDRRYFVWRSKAYPQPPGYYRRLHQWLTTGGYERVLHFLQGRDISRFSPFAPPPRTASRAELAGQSRSDAETYLNDALEAGEAPFVCDLVVINHVCDHLAAAGRMRVTPKAVANVLRMSGAEELGQKRIGTAKPRVWALRNVAEWRHKSEEAIAAAYLRPGDVRSDRGESTAQPVRRLRSINKI